MVKSSSATAANNNLGSMTRVSTNSSYLGFKGVEDLGNGLKAVFQFESGVGFDAQGGFGATRDSYVGLAGNFGTVAAGNLTGPTRALGASLDVFSGSTGIGANSALLGKLGNNLIGGLDANNNAVLGADCNRSSTCTSLFDTRWKNAVAYISPNLSGFTLTAAYVANENKAADNVAALNTKGYDVGANYSNGPITAGITYNAASLGNAVDTKANDLRIGGSYNFGVASLRLVYDRVKAENVALGGDELKQNVWGIGGTYNVTANGKLVAQYYKAGQVKGNTVLAGAETGAKLFALGYEHSLSKRTLLKATYSRLSNNDNANYDFGVNATGIAADGATVSGFQVGVRHSF